MNSKKSRTKVNLLNMHKKNTIKTIKDRMSILYFKNNSVKTKSFFEEIEILK